MTLYTDLDVDGTTFKSFSSVLMLCVFTALTLVGFLFGPIRSASAASGFSEEEIQFQSGDVTLHGTILVPEEASLSNSRMPAIALVHGAGPGPREQTRPEAEAFAREGIVTLIYDKRTEGYSQLERSYELLADDALAAARALRSRPEVDREAVGLWGLSEGGWVVPMAAARPEGRERVDFVVLVAASGVPPARQHAWNLKNELRHQGVSGSMVEAISRTGTRLLVGADMFAEANHDPVPPLEQLQQPVLALWGVKDRIEPPVESARIVHRALERGGNENYTIRFFPEAEHGLRSSPDGFAIRERFVSGYPETVASWVKEVASGEAPGPSIAGPDPEQVRSSRPLAPLAWWESNWVQLGAMGLPILAFASYPAVALVGLVGALARLVLGRPHLAPEPTTATARRRVRLYALLLSATGLAAVLGFVGYFGYLVFTAASAVGPVMVGRALPWLALQALAIGTVAFTLALAGSWWLARAQITRAELTRVGILFAGVVVFVAWAAYWGLLVP